jgi:dihydroxy-acid dehydratase
VLHISPEAAENGTIALVKDGDLIALDVPNRTLNLLVDDEELSKRRAALVKQPEVFKRGYAKLYVQHVEQANLGADFDFLKGSSGSEVLRDSH